MAGVHKVLRSAERLSASTVLRQFSSILAVQQCGRVPHGSGDVSLGVTDGASSVRGVKRCSSVHACPTCSAKIRAGRASQVDAAGVEWLDRGGELLFLTLTVPHDAGDDAEHLWRSIAASWSTMTTRRWWREQFTYWTGSKPGFVRVVEATVGSNGWHPHLHVLLFVDRSPGQGLSHLRDGIHALWASIVTSHGWRAPSVDHGVDLQAVCSRTALTRYLCKVDGYGKVAAEMARGDLKGARHGTNRTPFQVLADVAEWGDRADLRLWWQWEKASFRKQFMSWSVGLRDRLGVLEVTDEELAEARVGHVDVAWVPGRVWSAAVRAGAGHLVLHAISWGDELLVRQLLAPFADSTGLQPVSVWVGLPDGRTVEARGRPFPLCSSA